MKSNIMAIMIATTIMSWMTSLLSIDDIFRMILNILKSCQIYDKGEEEIIYPISEMHG